MAPARHRLRSRTAPRPSRSKPNTVPHRVHCTRSMCIAVITSDPIPPVKPSTRSWFSSPTNLAHAFLDRRDRPCAARREEEAHALRRRGGLAGAQRHGRGLAGTGRSPRLPDMHVDPSAIVCTHALILASFLSLFIIHICPRSVRHMASLATARVSINQSGCNFRVVILSENCSSIIYIMMCWLH